MAYPTFLGRILCETFTQSDFFMKEYAPDDIYEFEDIDALRKFDSEFLMNIDSDIISNICQTLQCSPNDITDINVINAGLTNVSFSFECCQKSTFIAILAEHPAI